MADNIESLLVREAALDHRRQEGGTSHRVRSKLFIPTMARRHAELGRDPVRNMAVPLWNCHRTSVFLERCLPELRSQRRLLEADELDQASSSG